MKNYELIHRNTTVQDEVSNPHKFASNFPSTGDEYTFLRNASLTYYSHLPEAEAKARTENLKRSVEKARFGWACISAKSQRILRKSDLYERKYSLSVYRGITKAKVLDADIIGTNAPNRTDEVINRFSSKSRTRMIQKSKFLRKDRIKEGIDQYKKFQLPLPYFITLTFEENLQDSTEAKKRLNVFLQRFRRIDKDFAYIWKMEFQKRGAIHFHLAFFFAKKNIPNGWKKNNIHYMQIKISSIWDEIGNNKRDFINDSEINYGTKKTFKISTQYSGSKSLLAGTNVRACYNWDMFVGYIAKYMEKEEKPRYKAGIIAKKTIKYVRPPFKNVYFKLEPIKTGRFWAFSRNLDVSKIAEYGGEYYFKNSDLKQTLLNLNDMSFEESVAKCEDQKKIALKNYKGIALEKRLQKLENRLLMISCRWKVNQDKIVMERNVQFDLNFKVAQKIVKNSHFIEFSEIFDEWNDF